MRHRFIALQLCMDWVIGKAVDQSNCGTSMDYSRVTDLVFADVGVILFKSLEFLLLAFEALHEEVKLLGSQVS